MKLCITTNFKCGFLQLIDPINHLFYHEAMTDLSLGWTSIRQDSWIKGASLHPSLFSQCIKGGVITKLGTSQCKGSCKGTKQQRNKTAKDKNIIGMSRFGTLSHGLLSVIE